MALETLVLIFCVEFLGLSHLTCDLSQGQQMLLQAEQMLKMTSISLKMVEVVILSENSYPFVSCNNSYFLLSLR